MNTYNRYPEIMQIGEDSILVQYEDEISREVNLKVLNLSSVLKQLSQPGVKEVVQAYRSLMVYFDPFVMPAGQLIGIVKTTADNIDKFDPPRPRLIRLPTVYGGEFGPDLEKVSQKAGISPDEVVDLFSKKLLPVYCLGFLCGLAYLGDVPQEIQLPRLDSPRPKVAVGSVGFAGSQANVLPITTPSGFNYIGRTFVPLYDPRKFPPTMIQAGDYVQCPAVSEETARQAGEGGIEEYIEVHEDH